MRAAKRLIPLALLALLLVSPMASVMAASSTSSTAPDTLPIKHIFIFVQENHTFDNYFGYYPGVNGLAEATPQPVPNSTETVKPFELNSSTPFAGSGLSDGDLCHLPSCAQADYDHGKMDGFLTKAGEGSNMTMGYFNPDLIPYYWDYAYQYVLMDDWFTPFMGPSLPNHIYLLAGQSGGITTNNITEKFSFPTIVDELDAANVSWAYFAGSHGATNDWNPLPSSTTYLAAHPLLQDLYETTDFPGMIAKPGFPSVAWVMPEDDTLSEHPPYNITTGEHYVVDEINDVMKSQYWNSSAIILTWDDYGGWYDSVSPPQVDQYGFGFRAPALIISPYAKHGFVDNTVTEDASTLKLIETVFHVPSLGTRDAKADDLLEAFNFDQLPRHPLVLPGPFVHNHYPLQYPNGTELGPLPQGKPGQPLISPTPSPLDYQNAAILIAAVSVLVVGMGAVVLRGRRGEPALPE